MIDLATALIFASGVVSGAIVALKVIAPRTKTKVDDKVLSGLEKAKDVLDVVSPVDVPAGKPSAPQAPRPQKRDHR